MKVHAPPIFRRKLSRRNCYIALLLLGLAGWLLGAELFAQREPIPWSQVSVDVSLLPMRPTRFGTQLNRILCDASTPRMVTCEKTICRVASIHFWKSCVYKEVDVDSESTNVFLGYWRTMPPQFALNGSDFVLIMCDTGFNRFYKEIVYGVRPPAPVAPQPQPQLQRFNVLIVVFEALSHSDFKYALPRSYAFLRGPLEAVIVAGMNSVGADGTLPLLTGHTEAELVRAGHAHVDEYPLLWQRFANSGYATAYSEDSEGLNTGSNRLVGFKRQPVDHYMRPFFKISHRHKGHCILDQPDYRALLDYTRQVLSSYRDRPTFSVASHYNNPKDERTNAVVDDDELLYWLRQMKRQALLDETLLVVMSNRGQRQPLMVNQLVSQRANSLPFVSFVVPPAFKRRFPQQFENLKENALQLVTPRDLHATFIDLLALQGKRGAQDQENKTVDAGGALSLFGVVPPERTCADAHIAAHWCASHRWRPVDNLLDYRVVIMSKAVVQFINNATKEFSDVCCTLWLKRIESAWRLQPHGPIATYALEVYQLKLLLHPGGAVFEANVVLNTFSNAIDVTHADIIRLNEPRQRPKCIRQGPDFMWNYCICVKNYRAKLRGL